MRRRRPLTCHHEAGHALARWHFGYWTERVSILSAEEIAAGTPIRAQDGRLLMCEGFLDGDDICTWPYSRLRIVGDASAQARSDRSRAVARDIALVECMAGIAAEARYRKIAVGTCAIEGGSLDIEQATAILDAWGLHGATREQACLSALRRASAIVGSLAGRKAIRAIVEALLLDGTLDGVEIRALCRRAYGGRECARGAWDEHWPPTLKRLRSGSLPENEGEATSALGLDGTLVAHVA